jgi:hypothetical protein
LTYGGAGCCGPPQPDAVSIRQARDDDVGRGYIGSDEVPPAGSAALQSGSTYRDGRAFPHSTAVMRLGRLLVSIAGPSRELVLDVARNLRPIPADAR